MGRVLCHPGGAKSCGACCGMYNHVEHGSAAVTERLHRRTLAFREEADVEDGASLRAFRLRWEDEKSAKLLTELPSCPFLGFIDVVGPTDRGGRVGCLVHPLQNDGVDGRDCGVYDRFICEDYLCAAHEILREREIELVLAAVEDSYLYGLVITNPRFVRSLVQIVADRTGAEPAARVLESPAVIAATARCFELLRSWPFRGPDGIFGPVEVSGPLDTSRRRSPAEAFGAPADEVDTLLICLGTVCSDMEELQKAREAVREPLDALASVVAEAMP